MPDEESRAEEECPCCHEVVDVMDTLLEEECPACGATIADLLEASGEDPAQFGLETTSTDVDPHADHGPTLGGVTD